MSGGTLIATPTIRHANERGETNIGWLKSRHTFSFGEYHDRKHMGFRTLRVINDDLVAPGGGFGTHGHQDMEILSLVLRGGLAHRDSLGHEALLGPGEIQVMSAGSGIRHSEFNASESEPVHFLQIWIFPEQRGLTPAYVQQPIPALRPLRWVRIAGRERLDADGAARIHQDANVSLARIEAGERITLDVQPERGAWLHVINGAARSDAGPLAGGDALALDGPGQQSIVGVAPATDLLWFDLK